MLFAISSFPDSGGKSDVMSSAFFQVNCRNGHQTYPLTLNQSKPGNICETMVFKHQTPGWPGGDHGEGQSCLAAAPPATGESFRAGTQQGGGYGHCLHWSEITRQARTQENRTLQRRKPIRSVARGLSILSILENLLWVLLCLLFFLFFIHWFLLFMFSLSFDYFGFNLLFYI